MGIGVWLNTPNFCTDIDSTIYDSRAFLYVTDLCATAIKFDVCHSHIQYINDRLFPDSEHRILHLLLARERLARFEAKWSPAAREAGHYESVRTQGGHGLTSAATEGAKTESKVLREAGHCESVRTQCDPGLTAAATDGAKTEPNVHRGEPDLQVCPVDPGVPGELLGCVTKLKAQ